MNETLPCRFVEVYGLAGASGLTEGKAEISLLNSESSTFSASLQQNPVLPFRHVDTVNALSARLLVKGLRPLTDLSVREEAIHTAARRRETTYASSVYAVFMGEASQKVKLERPPFDTGDFRVCIEEFSNSELLDGARPKVRDILSAIILSHSGETIEPIRNIGSACFLIDGNNKPIYNLNISISASASISSPLSKQTLHNAISLFPLVPTYRKITSLIVMSLDDEAGELQSFICSWTAMEIFVNTSRPGKNSLRNKFRSIAQELNAPNASFDEDKFAKLKKFRDNYFHKFEADRRDFPTRSVLELLLKYLNLKVNCEVGDGG